MTMPQGQGGAEAEVSQAVTVSTGSENAQKLSFATMAAMVGYLAWLLSSRL
jgi:hypothetical protein